MNFEQLKDNLNKLDIKHNKIRNTVIENYAKINSRYKVGDKFTDHHGSITIEQIRYYFGYPDNFGYFGRALNKNGSEKKIRSYRTAILRNEVKP